MTDISPSKETFLEAVHEMSGLTSDNSFRSIKPDWLAKVDAEAKTDTELEKLTHQFQKCLTKKKGIDDVISASQAYEVYGEIKVYRHLKEHGFTPKCIPTIQGEKTPDFKCITPDGKSFYVEVKSFDVVNGEFANREMLHAGVDAAIDIETQQKRGERIATSTQVIAPYGEQKHGDSQVALVTSTIKKKFISNFKRGQFDLGPTFAFAVLDKLIVPGRQCAITPYYHQEYLEGSACITGTLWASAYAEPGYLLLDLFEFEGKPTHGGLSQNEGYFAKSQGHPAQAIMFFDEGLSRPLIYGLINDFCTQHTNWSRDDTEGVLFALCDAINDRFNAYGYSISNYDSRIDYPDGDTSKSAWDMSP